MSDIITPKWRDRLREELRTFDDDVRPLLSSQIESFRCCAILMREQPLAQLQSSRKHRYGRQRARNLLLSIFNNLCPELFLLCALALPVSDLSRTAEKDAVPNLREWWKTVDHPSGLKEKADALCKDLFKVNSGKSAKRPAENNVNEPRKRLSVADDRRIDTSPHIPLITAEVPDDPYSSEPTEQMSLRKIPHESLIDINLKDLLHFLIQHQQQWPDLVIKYP